MRIDQLTCLTPYDAFVYEREGVEMLVAGPFFRSAGIHDSTWKVWLDDAKESSSDPSLLRALR